MMNEKYDRQLADLQDRMQAARERENLHYDLAQLTADVKQEVSSIVRGDNQSEVFYKNILDHLTVYHDNRVELRLNLLPQKWVFVLDKLQDLKQKERVCSSDTDVSSDEPLQKSEEYQGFPGSVCYCDASVPISVSKPFSSG